MRHDLRWLIVLGGNLVFLFVVGQVNHHLTGLNLGFGKGPVHLFLLGLPVAFSALRLGLAQGLGASAATALAFEASLPLPPGLFMITAAACHCVTIAVRGNFNRFEPSSAIIAALAINLVLMLAATIAVLPVAGGQALSRIGVDLLVSQAIAAVLTGWFFAAQLAWLRLFGFDLETELRESP